MVLLNPEQAYILRGAATEFEERGENEINHHPKILHVKLPASILEAIIANQDGPHPTSLTPLLGGVNAMLLINEERHSLQYSAESNPHQLYSYKAGSNILERMGKVSSRLTIAPEAHPSSSTSATIRLKERRELEEARKTEHRAILLDSTPLSNRNRPVSSTSKLKLRAKGLAPASTSSPLIRSRANTPSELYSLPGSPSLGASSTVRTPPTTSAASLSLQGASMKASPLSRTTRLKSSPPTLRRRLIQLLANGPISKGDIVQHLHQPEPAILTLLDQVGQAAPDYLQPKAIVSKKPIIPANRRSLAPGQSSTANHNAERGAILLYILKDEIYRQVLIKDWAEYDANQRLIVSEHMEAALKRLKVEGKAEEWERLYPDGRASETVEGLGVMNLGDDLLSTNGEALHLPKEDNLRKTETSGVTVEAPGINKKANQDRIRSMKKNNAKAKNVSRTSTPTTGVPKASTSKKAKVNNAESNTEEVAASPQRTSPPTKSKATVAAVASLPPRPSSKAIETRSSLEPIKATKGSTSVGSKTQKATNPKPSAKRKDIEYTDSSNDEDGMQVDDLPLESTKVDLAIGTDKKLSAPRVLSAATVSSSNPQGKRGRQGVGSGAAFSSEPWLDVRNQGDWKRLAEKFKRVYEDYVESRCRLRDEEDLIRAELEQARGEMIKSDASLQIEEEREEGEASPLDGPPRGIFVLDYDPPSFANVTWRFKSESGKTEKTTIQPMSYKELEKQMLKLKEMEAQLTRMKDALQTSKKALVFNGAA